MDLKSLIRTVPNYPKPGILFRDISTLLYNGNALKYITEIYYNRYKDISLNGIAAIEARISGYTTSAKDTAVFNIVAAHIADTNVMRRVNTDIQNGLYNDVADYALQYTKTLRNTFKNL